MAKLFNTMIKAASLAALMALGSVVGSQAAVLTMTGTCESNCEAVGATDGDSYTGTIELVDTVVVPNGTFDNADVLGFLFELGTLQISDATAVGYTISGIFDSTASTLVSFFITVSEAILDDRGELMVFIGSGEGVDLFASLDGGCNDSSCTSGNSGNDAGLSRPEFTVEASEPAMLGLLGLGLAGFGLARRRRG